MVEIIPKPVKKLPPWQSISFYFSLALLAAVVFGYFILNYFEIKRSTALEELEGKISAVGTLEERTQEIEVFVAKKKIEDFSVLFSEHKGALNFFKFLEGVCHPKVRFSKIELNLDNFRAVISGKAPDFRVLGQQILILKNKDLIRELKLDNLSTGKGGEAEFSLSFLVAPALFNQ